MIKIPDKSQLKNIQENIFSVFLKIIKKIYEVLPQEDHKDIGFLSIIWNPSGGGELAVLEW